MAFTAGSHAQLAPSSKSASLYALAARVPLIKSHSISVPAPIALPLDLHPLPAEISAYFVYPFSLESYVLDPTTPSAATIEAEHRQHATLLESRNAAKLERQRETLQRLAPGWTADQAAPLIPTHSKQQQQAHAQQQQDLETQRRLEREKHLQEQQQERSPLDDLADHLAQLSPASTPHSSSTS